MSTQIELSRQWPDRYRRLLADSGLDPTPILDKALQFPDVSRPALFSLAQALEDPALLSEQMASDYPDTTTPGRLITRLSVLQLDLAQAILAPLTVQLFRYGESPVPDPDRIFLAVLDPGNAGSPRWFHSPSDRPTGVEPFIRETSRQLEDWYRVFRGRLGVSPGAYWSSSALGLGAPFSAVWNRADAQAVCELAQNWLEQFDCDAHRYMDWLPAGTGKARLAIPQRRGCCLKYLLPEGGYCGTCGVRRKERLDALRQARLQEQAE